MNDEFNKPVIKVATYNNQIAFYNIDENFIFYKNTQDKELIVEYPFNILAENKYLRKGEKILAIIDKNPMGTILFYIDRFHDKLDWTVFNEDDMENEVVENYTDSNFNLLDKI